MCASSVGGAAAALGDSPLGVSTAAAAGT